MDHDFDAPKTCDEAATDYDHASARFWTFPRERTVSRIDRSGCPMRPRLVGTRDFRGSGTGGLAVDLAPRMVALARGKVLQQNRGNIEVLVAGMTRMALPPE